MVLSLDEGNQEENKNYIVKALPITQAPSEGLYMLREEKLSTSLEGIDDELV